MPISDSDGASSTYADGTEGLFSPLWGKKAEDVKGSEVREDYESFVLPHPPQLRPLARREVGDRPRPGPAPRVVP